MDKIWGYDSETEQNVVWVYVSYLRKKLANLGSSVVIEAHRNLGYSLESSK
jgi:DNA-binding response OmpR family regulator